VNRTTHEWFRRGVRTIRGVVSIACLLACVGFAALWVRSYLWRDLMTRQRAGQYVGLMSWAGRVSYMVSNETRETWMTDHPFRLTYRPRADLLKALRKIEARIGKFDGLTPGFGLWRSKYDPDSYRLTVPHWFLVIVSASLAVVVKPKPRLQFSVRDLLVAMTIVAVIVAALAALPRSG
jgi:hypothetical protein